jgi:hypothetical protein
MDEATIKTIQMQLDAAKIEAAKHGVARMQQEAFNQQEETSTFKEQLDLSEEIARIDYLLKGYSLEPSKDGGLVWVKPTDKGMVIFSDYGIHLIRNTVCWYLNKNLLLSNFDENTIRKKMLDFTNDLIDTVFMEYDKVFLYPTVEDCIDLLKERVERRATISCYARELSGIKSDKEEVVREKFAELENRVEFELEKIRQQIIKDKLKRFLLIVRVIQDAIHSTFQRAWKGLERGSLRQHMHISETRGNQIDNSDKGGGMWHPFKRR